MMTDEYNAKMLMAQLLGLTDALINLLDSDEKLAFVGFSTSPVLAVDEQQVLTDGRQTIEVTKLSQWQHRLTLLGYYKQFYALHDSSTRFVSRLPGLIVTSLPATVVVNLISQINGVKDEIKTVVQHRRNHLQRHQFIHQVFPRLMTEQLYRHISCSQRQVKSVWFSWCAKRQVNQSFTPDAALQWLSEQTSKPKAQFTAVEWKAHIDATMAKIVQNKYRNVQRQRLYRTFPVADYSHYEDNQLKTNRFNAIMPWILLDQSSDQLPPGTGLKTFIRKEQVPINKLSANAESLFKPLKLIGVY